MFFKKKKEKKKKQQQQHSIDPNCQNQCGTYLQKQHKQNKSINK